MTGHAIVFPAPQRAEWQPYEVPALRPDEMRVRTEYSGVSQGTEIWAYLGKRPELSFPTVPGYQSVGIVEEVGPEVRGFAPGQRALFLSSRLPDSLPPTWMGAHVSHALIRDAIPVPDDVDPVAAALAALPGVSLRGLNMLNIRIGDLVVVTGQGLIGQGNAQLARLRGATVIAAEPAPARRRLSAQHSADIVVDPGAQNLSDIVRSVKPAGADVVIETTGRADMFAPCIDLLRWEGQLLLQGWYPDPITFDFHTTHGKKPTLAVTCGMDNTVIATCLDLMARGKLRWRELVTDLVPVADAPALYPKMAAADPDVLGVVFDWGQGG
ncbi:MAG: zinc-binding alcohol dehydrogenase [Armatimonadetes bacterium]|nr:zinc-binding alcohol dehydrogenase [Armatimonadota bacterium]